MPRYETGALLGRGSDGTVHHAFDTHTAPPTRVALKRVRTAAGAQAEAAALRRVPPHECIVALHDVFESCVVLERCDAGAVADVLRYWRGDLELRHIVAVVRSALRALEAVHAARCVHRDVKAANLLMTWEGRVKLADFGAAAALTDAPLKSDALVGSPYWLAPETLTERVYGAEADIWSLGITAIELVDGVPPLHAEHPFSALFCISQSNHKPSIAGSASPELHDFVALCCRVCPDQRPSATELLKHPLFNSQTPNGKSADAHLGTVYQSTVYQNDQAAIRNLIACSAADVHAGRASLAEAALRARERRYTAKDNDSADANGDADASADADARTSVTVGPNCEYSESDSDDDCTILVHATIAEVRIDVEQALNLAAATDTAVAPAALDARELANVCAVRSKNTARCANLQSPSDERSGALGLSQYVSAYARQSSCPTAQHGTDSDM